MHTTATPQPAQGAIELQEGGLCVRLAFSLAHPEFSTPLAERPTYDARLSAELCPADQAVVQMAAQAAPLLLQAFEQAQSVVALSLVNLSLARSKALQANFSAGVAPAAGGAA